MANHPVYLLHQAIPPTDPDYPIIGTTRRGVCCLTGDEVDTVPRKDVLGRSFTTGSLLRIPDSDRIGIAAAVAMRYKWERMSSWICDGTNFKRLDRVGVREAVFGKVPLRPWVGYATTSYKKHGALRAPVNVGDRSIWLFEERPVDCSNRKKVSEWWDRLNAALRDGFGRSILEQVECPPYLIEKAGLTKWLDFAAFATDKKQSALYAFLCYLLPSQEELKQEKNK